MNQTPFVPLEAVAKYFVVSQATIRNWMRIGAIPKNTYIKVGHTHRFNLPLVVEALTNVPQQLELDLEGEDE